MKLQVRILTNNLPAYAQGLPAKAKAVKNAAGNEIVKRAKSRVPVRTGKLKNSIHTIDGADDALNVVADADYAAYVEFGTHHSPAQPFLTPAAAEVKPVYAQFMQDALNEKR